MEATAADELYPVPSPDGRWIAYTSNRTGRSEVFIRLLGDGGVIMQVSLDGGAEPVWSRDGRELFYRRGTRQGSELIAAALRLDGAPQVVSRTALFDASACLASSPRAGYDVSPDGRWFAFTRRVSAGLIAILQNVPEPYRRALRATGHGS